MPTLYYKNYSIHLDEKSGAFTVEGNTFKTLKECHNWVDREKRKKYERVPAITYEERWGRMTISEVVITSPADEQWYGGQNVWISKDGKREKTQLNSLIAVENLGRLQEISKRKAELNDESDLLDKEIKAMTRPQLPVCIDTEKD